ncbi:hypothetical protein BN14_06499 [Rhizoctonia solani AG-1 IB]|uniref:Transmembrane protein n=1 Tax=Thanatephorus cucumeris (strain AG1-IB / isolate 7/3/14) TaxID=1108050 RepID=M5BYZ8_THACB|nr:hypothetical protein BN14_06499 [Rhizoctonia solani AG-1 IB]
MSTCDKPSSDFCTAIIANPDISVNITFSFESEIQANNGLSAQTSIQVRVALYLQTLLSMTIASLLPYHERAFRDLTRNAYIISTSLIIASLIEMKTHGLSLFDALIVTMLTTIMTAFVTVNSQLRMYTPLNHIPLAYLPQMQNLGLSISISSFLFTSFWCYWGLQVWHNPSTFGIPSDKENCTASTGTVFVVFGHNVSVTNSGLRGFALSMFAISLIGALASLYYSIGWLGDYVIIGPKAAKDKAARGYVEQLTRKVMSRFGGLAGMIYMIVTTEQIVDRNNVRDELKDWTYSQTIALILLGQQLLDCGSYWKEEIQYRQKERQQRSQDETETDIQRIQV